MTHAVRGRPGGRRWREFCGRGGPAGDGAGGSVRRFLRVLRASALLFGARLTERMARRRATLELT